MSDVTSLLMGLYAKTGVTVYYGTNFVTSYARLSPYREITLKCFIDVLNERDRYVYKIPKFYSDEIIDWNSPPADEKCISNSMVTLKGGRVQGRLIGGNMNTLTSVLGTPYMPEICDGDILFLENTEEWAGFTERYVMWLKLCGVFERIGDLIIGKHRSFDDCGIGKQSYEILNETIGDLHFPVLAGFDCSHCAPMLTLPIGVMAELDADAQTLTLLY